MISLTLRVMHRPDVKRLPAIYQSLGLDYDDRVLPSIGNEVLKAIVAQFDAGELITQREQVSARIREDLLKRAGEFNIHLEDVSITHLSFGQEFTHAVEQKQVAQQEAERARFIVEKVCFKYCDLTKFLRLSKNVQQQLFEQREKQLQQNLFRKLYKSTVLE